MVLRCAVILVAGWLYLVATLSGYQPCQSQQESGPLSCRFTISLAIPIKNIFADGLTEGTISQLGRLNPEQLGVIARASVMGYKHKDERLDQIGRDLSVLK